MATTVDQLVVEIKAETAGLRKGLDGLNRRLATSNKTARSSIATFGNLAKVFAAIGVARLAANVVNTSRTFEDLGATLKAITGSAEAAAVSFDLIRKFTSGTTFQLENVSKAFVTLLNAGITPTSDVLTDFGNIAAAFGKDITQIAQATFNATTGEMEMLKQFGIKAKLEGDKISMIFREQETEIGRNSTEIVEYLRNIAQENFSTALEERANTVSGVFSNLGDAASEVANAIGEGGLNTVLLESGRSLLEMSETAKQVGFVVGQVVLAAFRQLGVVLRAVSNQFIYLANAIAIFLSLKVAIAAVTASIAFIKYAKAVGVARLAMIALNKVGRANILLVAAIAVGHFTGALDNLIEKMKQVISQVTEGLGFDELFQLPEGNTQDLEALNAEIEAFAQNMSSSGQVAEQFKTTIGGELREAIIQTSHSFTNEFVNSLLDGRNALESFKNFAKNIVSQIIATFVQMMVVNKILNMVFGLTGTPNQLDTASPSAIMANLRGGGSGCAGGGVAHPSRPMLVGERGPEIFMPNSAGRIMNNADSVGAMGGTTVVVNQSVNFSTGIIPTVRAEVTRMLPQIAEVSKVAVLDAARRGGSFRKGLAGA